MTLPKTFTPTARDVLIAGKSLIEKGWTKHASARDSDSRSVWSNDPSATCWCIIGAESRAGSDLRVNLTVDEQVSKALYSALPAPFTGLAEFNDHPNTKKEDVLALFERAIALTPAEKGA